MPTKKEDERFAGEVAIDSVALKNFPSWLSVIQINLEGNLLVLQGMTHRSGNTKDVVWVYKRIRG